MKHILKASVLFAFLVFSYGSKAQQHITDLKPKLFGLLADKITFPKNELEKAFTTPEGNPVQLSLPGNITFSGTIISSIQRYSNLLSTVIKLNELDGTIFGISKRINDDASVTYVGRIINQKYGDGYELKSDVAGNYFINKIKTEELIQDKE